MADSQQANEFAQSADGDSSGIVREFWDFLRENKKWWLAPVVAMLLMMGALIALSGTAAAPFIYALF